MMWTVFPLYQNIWPLSAKLDGVLRRSFLSCPCFWTGHCIACSLPVFLFTSLPWGVLWGKQGKEWGSKRWTNSVTWWKYFSVFHWVWRPGHLKAEQLLFQWWLLISAFNLVQIWVPTNQAFPNTSILSTFGWVGLSVHCRMFSSPLTSPL